MTVQSPGKLIVLAIVATGTIVYLIISLFITDSDTTAAWATLTAIVGYTIGNGVGARNGHPQQPLFAPKEGNDEHGS